jgi:hypothetical protein
MAWTHRGKSPLIDACATNWSDPEGSKDRVKMTPRSFWDEDPRFLDSYTEIFHEALRQKFGESLFCPDIRYMLLRTMRYNDDMPGLLVLHSRTFDHIIIRGAEIVEALTAATKAEDLADAFDWFDNALPSDAAKKADAAIQDPSIVSAW